MDFEENISGPQKDLFKHHRKVETGGWTLPNHIQYLMLAASFTAVALFAIIKHLIKDLAHDLAEQPVDEQEFPSERREKFKADWNPEPASDLEAILQHDEILELMQGTDNLPTKRKTTECRLEFTMFHLRNTAAFIILSACFCQAQAGGQRASSDSGKVTLQPWLIGLAAVVGFLFIVFVALIIQRLFFKKEKKTNGEDELQIYENMAHDEEMNMDNKQTTF
ncbi:hypothetical protein DNTS_010231 [Danionella cerebrum]|uniref:Uncharacterized protein n=1 Tax=Danionella cerebrum TaxID=2873325 RepID=A0A553PEK3_9TELE|nr:hypothetical protein DNTS_010231 [Danionella translucida]TRY76108.1 hypothetical protein DNTS_010231 [Danionella translucida]